MTSPSIERLADDLSSGRATAGFLADRAVRVAQQQVPSAIEFVVRAAGDLASRSDERRQSGQALGPLDGVPFAVKANIDVAGEVTTSGLQMPAGGWWPAASWNAAVVDRLVRSGAIPVLTCTMAPMAMGSVTISPMHGPCRNPHDRDRHAGGSSGGSGAVVGADAVPFALGSDTLGSVRIPADYCQVTGWIPSPGSVDQGGMVPLCSAFDRLGVLCGDPRDLPTLIAALSSEQRPSQSLTTARVRAIEVHVPIDGAGTEAVARALRALQEAGGDVQASRLLDLDLGRLRRRAFLLAELEASRTFAEARSRGAIPAGMEALLDYGAAASSEALRRSNDEIVQAQRIAGELFADADLLLLPTTPGGSPLLTHDPPAAADLTAWVNVAGLPAVSVPVGGRSVQLIGRPGSDLLLAHAAASVWLAAESGLAPLQER